ncbi:MAG: type I glyceraldehyde-3-phosphate dehydrogenase [Bacteroidetes bacterium MED-G21]|nr:MAG: type I glyceraldehyde-3-phosphate dehydrogenase [Bacteroidetes bacterium MED-G21]
MIRIAINGFGRIGRLVFRASLTNPNIEVVAINDLVDAEYLAYLLKYDSVHGMLNVEVNSNLDSINVDGKIIVVKNEKNPSKLNWSDNDIDFVVEATGLFLTKELASKHLEAGAKKVIISAPVKDDTPMFVYGVNHHLFKKDMNIVSNASCTTNCLAPLVKVLEDKYGIESGLMTTVHAVTSTQHAVDGMSKKNWRLGRAAYQNIIPSSTGAAKAVGKIIPSVDGKLTGMAFRVPVANVSVVDLSVNLKSETNYHNICNSIKSASEGSLKNVLAYSDALSVSSDFVTNPHTSVFDANAGLEISKTFFKLVSWYDNEWGYSNKILDMITYMHDHN